jgi:ubiquinone/menaquinone biosynthesis C-methylase UbiE
VQDFADEGGRRVNASAVSGAPPDAYDRHVGRYGAELAAGMIRIAEVRPGQRAIDVGCGTGALAVALAALLGEENVAAIDPSERFVEVCRSRIPGADVRVGVAESMPFGDASFDAVLAQLVVDGMDDARQGLAEMRRVARSGGTVAACVWDFDGGMTLLRAVWKAALALDEDRAHEFGANSRRPSSRPEELKELWHATGLEDVAVGKLTAGADYADLDDLWYPFAAGVGRLGAFVQALDETARSRMKLDVGRNLGNPSGPFRLIAEAWYVRGRA